MNKELNTKGLLQRPDLQPTSQGQNHNYVNEQNNEGEYKNENQGA